MSKPVTQFFKYFLFSHLFAVVLIGLYWLSGGSFSIWTEMYNLGQIIFGLFIIELLVAFNAIFMVKENRTIRDEREQLIELKAYKVSLRAINIFLGIYFLWKLFGSNDLGIPMPLLYTMIFANLSHILSVWYFRKTT